MRKTALILAGAAAFDLGVMAVAAQAQQQTREPPPRPGSGPVVSEPAQAFRNKPTFESDPPEAPARLTSSNRDHIDQDAQLRSPATRGETETTGEISRSVGAPDVPGACAQGKHLPDTRVSACRAPAVAAEPDFHIKMLVTGTFTAQTCRAQRGQVVRHEGVQQCRLPAANRRDDPNSAMGAVSTTR